MPDDTDVLTKIPKYNELIYPVVKALKALGGSGSNEEILDKVCELEKYPAEVQEALHTDGKETALGYRIAWAKTYLKFVGAVDNSQRGVWTLTEKGSTLTAEDCKKIPAEVQKLQQTSKKKSESGQVSKKSPEAAEAAPEGPASWRDQLLSTLLQLKPDAFERLAQRLLREAGFTKVQVTGKSGDGGIDGMGVLRVNLVSFTVLFQCKRYQGSVGAPTIRDFRGAMQGRCDKGLIITTGTFSSDARREATRDGAPAIDLIDGESLCDLLKQLKLGIKIETVEQVTVEPAWFFAI
jgi:restriction system protein